MVSNYVLTLYSRGVSEREDEKRKGIRGGMEGDTDCLLHYTPFRKYIPMQQTLNVPQHRQKRGLPPQFNLVFFLLPLVHDFPPPYTYRPIHLHQQAHTQFFPSPIAFHTSK
ncbi:hypothetical protein ACQ4LE_004586 [Meloidogyne hapla]